jgi:YggT family protein
MDGRDFLWGFLPFWLLTYALAAVAWTCVGRFLLQFALPPDSPNYIWRAFRALTDWAVAAARRLVPSYVTPPFLPLVAAFWLFGLRVVLGLGMLAAGWAPRLTPPPALGGG